jgi:hypothetical protein
MIGGIANPTLEEKVCRGILAACQRANWKLGGPRGAAARLGLKRNTLFYKMSGLASSDRRMTYKTCTLKQTAFRQLDSSEALCLQRKNQS